MNKGTVKRQVKADSAAVRRVLLAWDPICAGGLPNDEYDCLVDRIVSALYQGTTEQDIAGLIASELNHHFGIIATVEDINRIAAELIALRARAHGSTDSSS